MRWPHEVQITRPSADAGAQNPDTGAWTKSANGDTILYDARGDMQHKTRQLRRGEDRDQVTVSDADVFLKDETDLWMLHTDDRVRIVDREALVEITGKLLEIDHLSGRLMVGDLHVVPISRTLADDSGIRATANGKDRTV